MSPYLLLFLLRLAGAILLLSFLGLIFWFLYRDLKAARFVLPGMIPYFGSLRILENTSPVPPINSLIDLTPITTIGRNSRNSIVFEDSYVSGEHALLTWRDAQWWLEDLGSRNGTQLNDVLITSPVVLSVGDIITIGGIRLKLEIPGRQETIAEDDKQGSIG